MTQVTVHTDEPTATVTITVPVRLLPQLVATFAAAATPPDKACVQTTGEEAPPSRPGPGLTKARPPSAGKIVLLRRAG